ncbi:hypothetical protein K437DRAFT_257143 [Tilletiaria anomala UBC 951]|uniref:Uncharacterized protein n=1 Tax=Tilletiaria anomala (strain ATCC 24038 / CBS 436.72 / UBC 951) TaxID=1037660 RepID=A0A066VVG8_TILAU|nr:uncharacterized protein K437DRAFT_257143 [Tilletiaria anomala UBC 951]KDN44273.1 hypothetical protein K437DRAFT_257143 [Tilletiaria anomala UBC 951]
MVAAAISPSLSVSKYSFAFPASRLGAKASRQCEVRSEMEGVSSNLGRLLKQTRLSAHHPSQVYAAAPAFASRGDFGWKKPLPVGNDPSSSRPSAALGRLRYLQVSQQETHDGQMEWRENERDPLFRQRWSEKGARLAGFLETQAKESSTTGNQASYAGRPRESLGPRIRTVFDSATYRLLPSDIPKTVGPPEEAAPEDKARYNAQERQYDNLRSKSRIGAFTPPGLDDPFGSASTSYSRHLDLFPNYRQMSDKEFKRFLGDIRQARHGLKQKLQKRMEDGVRNAILLDAKRVRERTIQLADDAASRGATPPEIPDVLRPEDVKLPSVRADMWDEARTLTGMDMTRHLKERHVRLASTPSNRTLPQPTQVTRVHPSGGLQYSQPDELYTQRLSEALPGRVIVQPLPSGHNQQFSSLMRKNTHLGVASGGHVEQLPAAVRDNLVLYDPAQPSKIRAESKFRVISATMESRLWNRGQLPAESLQSSYLGYIQAKVRPSNETEEERPLPGSTAFIGAKERPKEIEVNPSLFSSHRTNFGRSGARTSKPSPSMPADGIAENLGRVGVESMLRGVSRTLAQHRSQ